MLLVNEKENELIQIKRMINKMFDIHHIEFANKVLIYEDETYGKNVN